MIESYDYGKVVIIQRAPQSWLFPKFTQFIPYFLLQGAIYPQAKTLAASFILKMKRGGDENSRLQMPEELITEILLKLPVESLLKFRCVSKSWLSLISSPDFVRNHLLLSASDKDYTHHRVVFDSDDPNYNIKDCSLSSLLHDSVTEAFDLDYPGKCTNHDHVIVGSFNGLICLTIIVDNWCNFYMWNPSIRKYYALPDYMPDVGRLCYGDIYGYVGSGFAYDEFQDDYKVVSIFRIYAPTRSFPVEVKIYSLRSNSWRHIPGFQGSGVMDLMGKVVNGKLHWLDNTWNIISIDLAYEKWAKVEKPCCTESRGSLVLGVIGSDLSLFYKVWGSHIDIWVMKEYGVKESWTRMFTIKWDPPEHRFSTPIFMSNEGEILLGGSCLTKYNPKDDSIRHLDVTNFTRSYEAVIYLKSLIWPF